MGNLRRQGYGSSSPSGLCNTHTNYNLNDGADDCSVFTATPSPLSFTFITSPSDVSAVKYTMWTKHFLDTAERTESKLPRKKHYSLAFEVLRQKWMVMGELRVPALTCHTLRSDIHCSSVICAPSLDAGCCYIDICVFTGVRLWRRKKNT